MQWPFFLHFQFINNLIDSFLFKGKKVKDPMIFEGMGITYLLGKLLQKFACVDK